MNWQHKFSPRLRKFKWRLYHQLTQFKLSKNDILYPSPIPSIGPLPWYLSLCSFVPNCWGDQTENFLGKNPQVHLIIIREWPKNNTPILRNLDNIPPGVFIWPTLQLDTKEYCNYFTTIFSKTAWILSAELQNYLKRLSGLFLYFQRYFNSTWLVPKL